MNRFVFSPADILLPAAADMQKWSVVACDQFSSEPEYWDRVNSFVGDAPSTLRLITPEAYLDRVSAEEESQRISGVMREYLDGGIFKEYKDSFVYVERTQLDGSIRRGLVGKIDLEEYDYTPGSGKAVAASEKTVVSRLPVRIEIRKNALIELPHIMVFFSDPEKTAFEMLCSKKDGLAKVYDFELMENGGNIKGWIVGGKDAEEVTAALASCGGSTKLVIGDGNHSLAAAKEYWNSIKKTLGADEIENHPARFALAEINNVYDDSIQFEPIHRVVFDSDPDKLLGSIKARFGTNGEVRVPYVTAAGRGEITLPKMRFGDVIGTLQGHLEDFTAENGGTIDYIHGDNAAESMGKGAGCIAFLLPKMGKDELFATVAEGRVFPKKSFSVGLAPEKRYYLECRKIVK